MSSMEVFGTIYMSQYKQAMASSRSTVLWKKTYRIHVTTLLGLFQLYKVFGAIHTPQYKWPISVSVNKLL